MSRNIETHTTHKKYGIFRCAIFINVPSNRRIGMLGIDLWMRIYTTLGLLELREGPGDAGSTRPRTVERRFVVDGQVDRGMRYSYIPTGSFSLHTNEDFSNVWIGETLVLCISPNKKDAVIDTSMWHNEVRSEIPMIKPTKFFDPTASVVTVLIDLPVGNGAGVRVPPWLQAVDTISLENKDRWTTEFPESFARRIIYYGLRRSKNGVVRVNIEAGNEDTLQHMERITTIFRRIFDSGHLENAVKVRCQFVVVPLTTETGAWTPYCFTGPSYTGKTTLGAAITYGCGALENVLVCGRFVDTHYTHTPECQRCCLVVDSDAPMWLGLGFGSNRQWLERVIVHGGTAGDRVAIDNAVFVFGKTARMRNPTDSAVHDACHRARFIDPNNAVEELRRIFSNPEQLLAGMGNPDSL